MLRVAIDESGTHAGAPILCAAACLSTKRQWRLLVDEWLPIVSPLIREGKYYHAKDTRYDEVNKKLAELIVRRMDFVCAVTIHPDEYKDVAHHKFRSQYGGGAYALAVQALQLYVAHWCHRQGNQKVAYVLEAGAKGQSFLDKVFRLAMKPHLRDRFRILSYAWVGKGEPLIHPPDLVSHEIVSSHNGPDTPVNKILRTKTQMYHLDGNEIARVVDEVWALERELKGRP